MENNATERLGRLRKLMNDKGIDAVIIPSADPHQSEYLAPHWQVRKYLSGFTGSAGTLVVTKDKAALWTDSRYFIQAARQLRNTGIELMKDGLKDTPSIEEWIVYNLPEGGKVGIDGWLLTKDYATRLLEKIQHTSSDKIGLDFKFEVTDDVWTDRPSLPSSEAFIHDEEYAGESASSKIKSILEILKKEGAEGYLFTALDEIAWILNLRGSDVNCNPVNTAFLYISDKQNVLFIDSSKLTSRVIKYLEDNQIAVRDYFDLKEFLESSIGSSAIALDSSKTSLRIYDFLSESPINLPSPATLLKALKNDTQIKGFREAMRRDGAALCYAFKEIEQRLEKGEKTTEIDVADIILKHRKKQPLFFDESFATISGYGPNGAIVHYTATPETDATLARQGLLLVDSGAQYLDGTTDITRTISLGQPTSDEKRDFTLVLKGMIALASAVFPEGTRGVQLDVLAHQYLWRAGQNYLHGTGHGVGHFLNVHEGPQTIRNNNNETPLLPGMVTSDEPGLYKEGKYGIRCENLILTIPVVIEGADSFRYLGFETLTLFPFDLSLIDEEIFTEADKLWLNSYHSRVYEELAPLLDEETKQWLKNKTLPIK